MMSANPSLQLDPPVGSLWGGLEHVNNTDGMADVSSLSVNHTSNFTADRLWLENDAYALQVIPSMVYVALLMVIAVPGNGLVVYVYGVRFRTATQHFLIVCLAVCDLVIGLIAMPTEIADLRLHLTFSSNFACRLLRFISLFCNLTSNCILVVIAVDRYRRVCHPLHRQVSTCKARMATALSVGVSLFVSWPLFVITGLRTVETSVPGLYGKDCSFSDEFVDTVYPMVLMGILGAGFLVMTVVLTVLYAKIWRQARKHCRELRSKRHRHPRAKTSSLSSINGTPSSSDISFRTSSPFTRTSTSTSTQQVRTSSRTSSEGENSVISFCPSVESPSLTQNNDHPVFSTLSSSELPTAQQYNNGHHLSREQKNTNAKWWKCSQKRKSGMCLDKTTVVAFAVTVVFVISFLPYLILMLVRGVWHNFDNSLTTSLQLNFYNIFVRSYFLNSAANPIIYGVLNAKFRRECVMLFRRLTSFLCFCKRCVHQNTDS